MACILTRGERNPDERPHPPRQPARHQRIAVQWANPRPLRPRQGIRPLGLQDPALGRHCAVPGRAGCEPELWRSASSRHLQFPPCSSPFGKRGAFRRNDPLWLSAVFHVLSRRKHHEKNATCLRTSAASRFLLCRSHLQMLAQGVRDEKKNHIFDIFGGCIGRMWGEK